MAKIGRPTKYTEKITNEICERISRGQGLAQALREMEAHKDFGDETPSYDTVMMWLRDPEKESFTRNYARAREEQADWDADHIRTIAQRLELAENRDEADGPDKAARLYIWLAGKRKPKVYGDLQKLEHSGAGGAPLQIVINRPAGGESDGG